jgi:hypothetical protein
MDGVLCDRPQDGCYIGGKRNYARDNISNTTKKETKMKTQLSADQLTRYVGIRVRNPAAADRYWARCMGRDIAADAAIDDETAARIKEFLSDKLSDKDHTKLCSMLAGDDEAQDTEPPLDDVETPPLPGTPRPLGGMDGLSARQRMQATDSMLAKRAKDRDDFFARFPDAARIGIDNSGIQPRPRGRASSVAMDAAGVKRFAEMFPDAARIRLL